MTRRRIRRLNTIWHRQSKAVTDTLTGQLDTFGKRRKMSPRSAHGDPESRAPGRTGRLRVHPTRRRAPSARPRRPMGPPSIPRTRSTSLTWNIGWNFSWMGGRFGKPSLWHNKWLRMPRTYSSAIENWARATWRSGISRTRCRQCARRFSCARIRFRTVTIWGWQLYQSGDVEAATKQFETLVVLAPQWRQGHVLLATAYAKTGRAEEAIKEMRKNPGSRPQRLQSLAYRRAGLTTIRDGPTRPCPSC